MPIFVYPSLNPQQEVLAEDLAAALTDKVVWIDLLRGTPGEVATVEKVLGIALPTREEMREIESTSRLYCEDGARFMTTPLLFSTESDSPELTEVSFVLVRRFLLTIRDVEPLSFRQTAAMFTRRVNTTRDQVFVTLIETIIDRQADLLERISKETEELSQRIFTRVPKVKESESNLREAIFQLGRSGNLIARERDCIVSLSRLVQYAGHEDFDEAGEGPVSPIYPRLKPVMRDLQSLSEFAGFLSSKVNFMLDATLGLINIEQNAIVKIFSVAAVIFLPPTLVASIYGMNFRILPEKDWEYGYPFSLLLMVISVLLPFIFCRKKGWL
ncbi:MAG: magnesium transporter CorA family protein [Gloeobacteraceae cyanobacterium ES-bin-144]|nr:magnesium transporter CorA family protein [Verrucomicrobiales bacterium]